MVHFCRNNLLLVFLAIYISTIITIPLLVAIPTIHRIVHTYLSPLGALRPAYISFAGTSIGSFLAISGAVWVHSRNEKHETLNVTKNLAYITYCDLKFAYDKLLPIYQTMWKMVPNEFPNDVSSDQIQYFLAQIRLIYIYLNSDWMKNIANLNHVLAHREIKEVYHIYENYLEIKRIVAERIKDEKMVKEAILRTHRFVQVEYLLRQGEVSEQAIYVIELLRSVSKHGSVEECNRITNTNKNNVKKRSGSDDARKNAR